MGMHRSGTSLVANWLSESGVFLGNETLEASESNRKGHHEDKEFIKIHIEDLQSKGLNGTGLLGARSGLKFAENATKEIEKLKEARNTHRIWGWKDPRSVLYLDHYSRLFPKLKVIILFRDANSVVNSLVRRDRLFERKRTFRYRNPIKLLKHFWLFYISDKSLRKAYLRVYEEYNRSLADFYQKNKSSCFLISHQRLVYKSTEVKSELETFLNNRINLVNLNQIFDQSLVSASNTEQSLSSKEYDRLLELERNG